MEKFKVGDKVYAPLMTTKIVTLNKQDNSDFPLSFTIDGQCYGVSTSGKLVNYHATSCIFHANLQNRGRLGELYGVEFETPKPEMVRIGNFEFPKPETEPLQEGEVYYTPCLDGWELYEVYNWYSGMHNNEKLLEDGLVHKTQEAAEQHARVLIAISQGKTSLED